MKNLSLTHAPCAKKFFSLLFVIMAGLCTTSATITVRLDASSVSSWNSVYLYSWTNTGEPCGAWPGIQLSQDNDNWYSYTFNSSIENVNIIWNSGQGAQTINIENVTESTCYALKTTTGSQIGINILDCESGEQTASSYEQVQIGDLYYNLNGMNHTAEVTYHLYSVADNYANMDRIVIPSSVDYLEQSYSVTAIGNNAFYKCINLSTVTIPSSIDKIGIMSFAYCAELDTIFCEATTLPTLGNDVFYDVNQQGCYLIVPEESLDLYKSANIWKNFKFEGDDDVPQQALITIDGLFEDWNAVSPSLLATTSLDQDSWYDALNNIKFCADSNYIYFYLEFSGDAEYANNYSILMNTDNDASTGFNVWLLENSGADFLIEDGMLFKFEGSDQEDYNWTNIGDENSCIYSNAITLPNSHRAIEGKILRADFNTVITSLQVGVLVMDNNWMETGYLPQIYEQSGTTIYSPMLDVPIIADEIPTSGYCGENLTWSLENGVLTISGTGAMTSHPWNISRNGITSVVMSEGITEICANAFDGCVLLSSVNIPISVTSIGANAFAGCTQLPVIDNIRYADTYLVEVIDKTLPSYTIQPGTLWIGNNAFSQCQIWSITIPDNIIGIGSYAFGGLLNVNYHGTATGAPWGAKAHNGYVDGWFVYNDESKTELIGCARMAQGVITIPNSVTHIANESFNGCSNVTSIIMQEGLTSIGNGAFANCYNLASVTIPNSVIEIGNNAFLDCKAFPVIDGLRYADTYLIGTADYTMNSFVIRDGTKWIGDDAFSGNLTAVVIPPTVIRIGLWAFRSCGNLTDITLPDSLQSIGASAFAYCTGLTSVTIPEKVVAIEDGAFMGCSSLTSITSKALTPPEMVGIYGYYSLNVFDGVDKTIPLYVPEASINLYRTADQWQDFSNILPIGSSETAIESIDMDSNASVKIFHNGQIFIRLGDKIYTLTGQEVK